jgi:raffinose/stachyose/melibiose transport system permease protein
MKKQYSFTQIAIKALLQALMLSIKTPADFTLNPVGLPKTIIFTNYLDAWNKGNFTQFAFNSVFITVITVLLTILLASPAGFALAKLKPKGGKLIYSFFILGMIIPVQVIMIPLMKMGMITHLNDTLFFMVLIFTATGLSFPLLIYTSFYKGLPMDIIEAAKIDGCNLVYLFIKIIFPLTRSVNATIAILAGMYPWKDLFIPLVFGDSVKLHTLTLGLLRF